MPRVLTKLLINEVSSVDRGAGEGVKVVLMKRDGVEKRTFSAAERRTDAKSGAAMPGGRYPIENATDLHNAIREVGRGKGSHAAIRAHIKSRARALGLTDQLPDDWDGGKTEKRMNIVSKALSALGWGDATVADELTNATADLHKRVSEIVAAGGDPGEMQTAVRKAFEDHSETLHGSIPDSIAKALKEADVADKGKDDGDDDEPDGDADDKKGVKKMMPTHAAYHDTLPEGEAHAFRLMSDAQREHHMKNRNSAAKGADDGEDDDVEKAAELKKRDDVIADLQKRLATMEDERQLVGFQKRAVELGLGEAHGETLMKARRGDAAAFDALEGLLKASAEQARVSGVFKEFGAAGNGVPAKPHDEIMAKAEELRKANPELSIEQAFAKAYSDPANRAIAKRERAENRPHAA